jgi:methylthioribose-1-phosphate isomerase
MLEAVERTICDALDRGLDPRAEAVAAVEAQAARWARQALATARHALPLVPHDVGLLTHCFADRSLLYLLLEARRASRTIDLYCSETRPYLQGARLTAMSAQQVGHPVTVITDGMGGFLMREGRVGAFVTAADRVCTDGTICNKVGTYQYALAARANLLPYYVLRQSGPDLESAGERDIHVEYRDPLSVLEFESVRVAPQGVNALYPAFDITPPELVTAIVTDRGVFAPSEVKDYAGSVGSERRR